MLSADMTLEWWDARSNDELRELAYMVEKSLAPRVRFSQLKTFTLDAQTHTIALFTTEAGYNSDLALLPGYAGDLGYDRVQVPDSLPRLENDIEIEDELDVTRWRDYVQKTLTPMRHVELPPFLIATSAMLFEVPKTRTDYGWVYAEGTLQWEYLAQQANAEGFRFPSSDEWEYACSGGARTLFRWGDAWPPIRWTSERQRESSAWRDDLRPNAFGLAIAQHPWHLEYCLEPTIMRGGDGGTAVSSDAGRLAEWFVLASAYRWPFLARMINHLRQVYLRYTLSLPNTI